MSGRRVKLQWFQGDGVRTKECIILDGNSTVHFAKSRGLDPDNLKLEDFKRQRWVFFHDPASGNFTVRFNDIVKLEYL